MGWFSSGKKCPHNRIMVSNIFGYLGHTSPTVRGFCVDDGKRVEFQVKGVSVDSPPQVIGKALSAMGWRRNNDGSMSLLSQDDLERQRRKKETARLERELGITKGNI